MISVRYVCPLVLLTLLCSIVPSTAKAKEEPPYSISCYRASDAGPYFSIFADRLGREACLSEFICGSPLVVGVGLPTGRVPLCEPNAMNVP